MSARRPDEVKAAVMAALLSGQGVAEVAETFNIPEGTVKTWKRRGIQRDSLGETLKRPDITELVFTYLTETLVTLAAQQRQFRDADWLAKQPANELAVLHGVSADKSIRLLEALQASGLTEHRNEDAE